MGHGGDKVQEVKILLEKEKGEDPKILLLLAIAPAKAVIAYLEQVKSIPDYVEDYLILSDSVEVRAMVVDMAHTNKVKLWLQSLADLVGPNRPFTRIDEFIDKCYYNPVGININFDYGIKAKDLLAVCKWVYTTKRVFGASAIKDISTLEYISGLVDKAKAKKLEFYLNNSARDRQIPLTDYVYMGEEEVGDIKVIIKALSESWKWSHLEELYTIRNKLKDMMYGIEGEKEKYAYISKDFLKNYEETLKQAFKEIEVRICIGKYIKEMIEDGLSIDGVILKAKDFLKDLTLDSGVANELSDIEIKMKIESYFKKYKKQW